MSIQSTQNNIVRVDKEIARLEKQLVDEIKKELNNSKKINLIEKSINKNTSLTQLQSKQNQIIRFQSEVVKIVKKKSDLSKNIADKRAHRIRYQQQLDREIKAEQNRQEQVEKRRRQGELRHHQQITSELQKQKQITTELIESSSNIVQKEYDYFISHATEDKESFVRPFAEKLESLGLNIWYDEFELSIGDSLRQKIDEGLINSRYAIVVLSNSFLGKKSWTEYELNGLVSKEMNGVKVILPIWHKVTKDEVLSYSPTLADKFAFNTSMMSINEIADELKKLVN